MPASFEYAEHKRLRGIAGTDMGAGGDAYLVLLLMVGSSAGQEPLVTNVAAFSALMEFDDTTYVRETLGSQTYVTDPATAEAVLDAADATFGAMTGDSSADVIAALIVRDGANDAARVPAFYINREPAFDPGTDPYTLQWNTNGIFRS